VLKQRLLTAAVLIPLVVWGIIGLSNATLGYILALFVLIGAWEWARLIGLQATPARLGYALLIALLLGALHYMIESLPDTVFYVLLLAGFWWLVGTGWVLAYKGGGLTANDAPIGAFAGVLVLVPTWLALTRIHAFTTAGPYLMLYVIVLMWFADSGAYFAGRKLGRHKLAPRVSPGKTIEGVVGGLIAAGIYALICALYFELPALGVIGFVALSLVVVLFSVVGDLFESLFKRRVGVKDSGQLLPGHGGMLDRIDSLTAAAPVFALGLSLFEGMR
jgi:phosphatidate cytidylyltransferase